MPALSGYPKNRYCHYINTSNKSWEWVHLNFGVPVPPIYDGSFNYLIWDLLQRRHPRDLLVCEYFPEAVEQAKASECAVAYIERPLERRSTYLIRRLWSRARNRLIIPLHVKVAAEVIMASGCNKVLVWDGIDNLPALRQLLPKHILAYSQRHYDYPQTMLHYNECDLLITQTRGQTRLAFERMPRLDPYVVTIPNGVELDIFFPATRGERNLLRRRFNLPNDRLVVIFPSKLAPHKGTRYLLQWIEACKDVHFLIVGNLHRLPVIHKRELEETLNSRSNVTWIRGCSRTEMPDYYRAADVCLMPGLWREGFSMAAIEAMSSGLPLIASKSGFYPEVLRNEYNGFLCRQEYLLQDVMNAICRFQDDPDLLTSMSRNARIYAEKRLAREKVLSNFDAFLDGRYANINDDLSIPE